MEQKQGKIFKIVDEHKSRRKWKNNFLKKYKWDAEELFISLCQRQFNLSKYSECEGNVSLYKNNKLIKSISFNSNLKR